MNQHRKLSPVLFSTSPSFHPSETYRLQLHAAIALSKHNTPGSALRRSAPPPAPRPVVEGHHLSAPFQGDSASINRKTLSECPPSTKLPPKHLPPAHPAGHQCTRPPIDPTQPNRTSFRATAASPVSCPSASRRSAREGASIRRTACAACRRPAACGNGVQCISGENAYCCRAAAAGPRLREYRHRLHHPKAPGRLQKRGGV